MYCDWSLGNTDIALSSMYDVLHSMVFAIIRTFNLVCDDAPLTVEHTSDTYDTTVTYIEGDMVTYTCSYNTTITDVITCNGAGNWETPSIDCPACKPFRI